MAAAVFTVSAADPELAPIPVTLPLPSMKGTPADLPKGPNIEPPPDKPAPPFMAPKGTKNVAFEKKVTTSDRNPIAGKPSQIVDGKKDAVDADVVELRKGIQWVQVDLGEPCQLFAIMLWHDHREVQMFRSVVVQAADDPDFVDNVTTLFNNDLEGVVGLGLGTDKQYFETHHGKLIPVKNGLKTRYLRFYSNGGTGIAYNCYQEIEVYGLPAK